MFKTRFISMLVLLAAVVTGARADWTGGTYTATANEDLGAITVNADATLTINEGVTVTVTGGINVASGTLTIVGPGTLVVNGAAGSDGGEDGQSGGSAISGAVAIYSGTITATGGKGGNGEMFGGGGGAAFTGTLTYYGGTVNAHGGDCGSGEGGSYPPGKAFNSTDPVIWVNDPTSGKPSFFIVQNVTFSGPAYVEPATVAVTGVTLLPTTATLTLGETETVTLTATVLPGDATDKSVTWSSSNTSVATVTDGVVNAVAAGTATITVTATNGTDVTTDDFSATCEVTVTPATYSVSLKSVTEDATSWQGKAGTGDYQELPLTGLEAGTAVSVKYSGTKKVKSVKAKKKQ